MVFCSRSILLMTGHFIRNSPNANDLLVNEIVEQNGPGPARPQRFH